MIGSPASSSSSNPPSTAAKENKGPESGRMSLVLIACVFDGLGDYFRLTLNLLSIDFRPRNVMPFHEGDEVAVPLWSQTNFVHRAAPRGASLGIAFQHR